jgi:hypothetical protein
MTILRVELGVELAAVKMLQGVTIEGLAALTLEQFQPADEAEAKPAAPAPAAACSPSTI